MREEVAKKLDTLGHMAEGILMNLVITSVIWLFLHYAVPALQALGFIKNVLPALSFTTLYLIGGLWAPGHYHGREKRDYESKEKLKAPFLVSHLIWRWYADQHLDFWPSVGLYLLYVAWYLGFA